VATTAGDALRLQQSRGNSPEPPDCSAGQRFAGAVWSVELLGCRRIKLCGNSGDTTRRKAPLLGMLPNHLFIGCDVKAVDPVVGHIALLPLNLGTHLAQYTA